MPHRVARIGMQALAGERAKFKADDLTEHLARHPQLAEPHQHDHFTLLFIDAGRCSLLIDGRDHELAVRDVAVIRPGAVHALRMNEALQGTAIRFTTGFFSLRYNNNVLSEFALLRQGARPVLRLTPEEHSRWKVFAGFVRHEQDAQRRHSDRVLRSYLNIILTELDRLHQPDDRLAPSAERSLHFKRFEQLLEEGFRTERRASAYAERLSITPNYLNKICRREAGRSTTELINDRVIIEAQRLLLYTDRTVAQIADELGFLNPSWFIARFKQATGHTPERFRASARR